MNQAMDLIELNKKAWNILATDTSWPYRKNERYCFVFEKFCSALPTGATVLDVGCGPGEPITKKLVECGFAVTGLDFSEKMIERAKAKVPDANFVCLSITDMQYEGIFDGVVASFALMGLDKAGFELATKNINHALKPGGYCFISFNRGRKPGEGRIKPVKSNVHEVSMYGSRYTEEQVRECFPKFDVVLSEREDVVSKRYGRENTAIFLLRKGRRRFWINPLKFTRR